MDLQHKSSSPLRAKDIMPHPIYIHIYVFLFNKTISLLYSLFVFRLCYKIIDLSSLNLAGRRLADRGLTHLWPAGMGLKLVGRAGPGPNIQSGSGLGLNSSLQAWAGLEKLLRAWAGPLTANCGPGLGSNSRPTQGTNSHTESVRWSGFSMDTWRSPHNATGKKTLLGASEKPAMHVTTHLEPKAVD